MARTPKTSRTETSVVQRAHIWTRYLEGHTYASISRAEGVPYSTVRDIIQKRLDSSDSTFKSQPRSGRPKKTTIRDERALVRHTLEHTSDTLKALATPSKSSRLLHYNTGRKILKSHGIKKRKPRKKPYLKPEHRAQRLLWSRAEKQGKRDWNKVCWSDEVTFEVGKDSRTVYVSRRSGKKEAFLDKNLKPSFKSGRTSVGVWSCYCGTEMGPLVILPEGGRMTA